jgi:hypothetical protein
MRAFLIAAATMLVALMLPTSSFADTFTADPHLSRSALSVGNSAIAEVDVHQQFYYVEKVCFSFTFTNDLFAPYEYIYWNPLAVDSRYGVPTMNFVGVPEAQHTSCLTDSAVGLPGVLGLFADGKERVQVWMSLGSVEIAHLVVSITGTPRPNPLGVPTLDSARADILARIGAFVSGNAP